MLMGPNCKCNRDGSTSINSLYLSHHSSAVQLVFFTPARIVVIVVSASPTGPKPATSIVINIHWRARTITILKH